MLRTTALLCLATPALSALGGEEASVVPAVSFKERRACKHYQAIGCITDLMERTCEGEHINEPFLSPGAEDSVYLCACPEPFAACTKKDRQDGLAHELIMKHIAPLGEDVKDKEVLVKALQDVRTGLWKDSAECRSSFANPKPYTGCVISRKMFVEKDSKSPNKFGDDGTRATIQRLDMYCELLTWQHEELGDHPLGEFKMQSCPTEGLAQAPKTETVRRKSQSLSKDEL
jgi:hypothetical protein